MSSVDVICNCWEGGRGVCAAKSSEEGVSSNGGEGGIGTAALDVLGVSGPSPFSNDLQHASLCAATWLVPSFLPSVFSSSLAELAVPRSKKIIFCLKYLRALRRFCLGVEGELLKSFSASWNQNTSSSSAILSCSTSALTFIFEDIFLSMRSTQFATFSTPILSGKSVSCLFSFNLMRFACFVSIDRILLFKPFISAPSPEFSFSSHIERPVIWGC